jgi:hypothetical protein
VQRARVDRREPNAGSGRARTDALVAAIRVDLRRIAPAIVRLVARRTSQLDDGVRLSLVVFAGIIDALRRADAKPAHRSHLPPRARVRRHGRR